MSVKVEVVGVPASGSGSPATGTGQMGDVNPSAASTVNTGSVLPSNERMVADIRREMQSRGVVLVPGSSALQQIVSQYGQQIKQGAYDNITAQYAERRNALGDRELEGRKAIDEKWAKRRDEELARTGQTGDPEAARWIEEGQQRWKDKDYRKLREELEAEETSIDSEERAAKENVDRELVEALKKLTDTIESEAKSGGQGEDSYIGRLRAQQRELIQERDSATTEEAAMDASKRLAGVNTQLRRAMGGGTSDDRNYYYDPVLQTTRGIGGLLGSVENGDIGGTITGAGGLVAGLSGMGMKSALKFMGWIGLAAGAANWLGGSTKNYEQLGDLAALRAPANGQSGRQAVSWLNTALSASNLNDPAVNPYGISAYGLLGVNSREDLIREASSRIHARGTSDHWYRETVRQIGLEQSYGLSKGALQEGGRYDRYGMNVTEALERMVKLMEGLPTSGVSSTDFTRVQEKYDIQQQIMSGFMSRSDKPDYNVANQILTAFSSIKGITQDARIGTDYQQFSDMIQNPQGDRMRTLIYSTIEDIMPETGGRLDLIDRALRDPKNEGKIMQAVISRITAMFGGTDTQLGYFTFKQLLPGIAPDRLDEYIKQFSQTGYENEGKQLSDYKAGTLLGDLRAGGYQTKENAEAWMDYMVKQAVDFKTGWSEIKTEIKDFFTSLSEMVTGTANVLQSGHIE